MGLSSKTITQKEVRARRAPTDATKEIALPARAFFLITTYGQATAAISSGWKVFNLYLLVSARVVESFWFMRM